MAKKIMFTAILAFLVVNTIMAQRNIRSWADEQKFVLATGIQKFQSGESGYVLTLGYSQKMRNSNFWPGAELRAARATNKDLNTPATLVGMDVTLGYRLGNRIYVQPSLLAGAGMVNHVTMMNGNIDPITGIYQQIERQQSFLSWELGGRIDLGMRIKSFEIGIFASYMKQFADFNPTYAGNNMSVESEWLISSPFSGGIALGLHLDHGTRHHGGNNVPLIEAFGTYGNRGTEAGAKVIWSKNSGLPWLQGREAGLRGEFVASSQYGLRFAETFGEVNRMTSQIGYGMFIHPKGPNSVLCYRLFGWCGLGELGQTVTSTGDEAYAGNFGTVKCSLKGNLEAEIVFHFGRFCASVLGGVSAEYVGKPKVEGNVSLLGYENEKPFAYYGGMGLSMAL